MAGGDFVSQISENFSSILHPDSNVFVPLLFFTAVIVIYGVFVYYFYKYLARKNIIVLNLNKYNRSEHPGLMKFLAFIFYVVEYIIILPILTFFWFVVFAIFLLMLARGLEVSTILIISAALIASVRITSYISGKLSQDLAKMIPFTILALSLTTPDFFSIKLFFEQILQIPSLITKIPYYLLFIIGIELIMRVTELIRGVFESGKEEENSNVGTAQ